MLVICAGCCYSPGRTSNKMESFAMQDAVHCLQSLLYACPDLHPPVCIFGDSQLLIRFILQIYKKPGWHTIYWAVEDVKHTEWILGSPVAYCHVMQEANRMVEDMAYRALAVK